MNTDYSYCSGVTCSIRKSCKRYLPDPPDTRLQWVWPAYNPGTDKCKYYGKDKNGKDKYHTYRRKDVLAFRKKYADDLLRPVFDWSAQQVIDYILENGIQPNPLYRMGYKRVGCFPCVMASQQDIYNISVQEPERISYIAGLEQQFNSSFFGPDKISSKYYKGEYPLISDVVRYVQSKRAGGSLFDDDVATSCMSYYGLCE